MSIVVPRRLPVFQTVRRAFELLWVYRALQLRIALPCVTLLSVAVAMGVHKIASVPPEKIMDLLQTIPLKYAVLWMAVSSIATILLMMFSVTWRRYLLLEIAPTTLIFSKPFRRYLLLFVGAYFGLVFGGTILADILLTFVQETVHDQSLLIPLGTLCLFIAVVAIVSVIVRFVLLFTAAAIDDHDMKLRSAAAYMKGNSLRFIAAWLMLVCSANFADNTIALVFSALGLDPATAAGSIVVGILTAVTMVVTGSLTASLAALTYDYLVRGGGPAVVR